MEDISNTEIRNAMRAAAQACELPVFGSNYDYTFYEHNGVQIGKYDQQSGYHIVLVFAKEMLLIKGYDNESPEAYLYEPGLEKKHPILNCLPDFFQSVIERDEFDNQYVSLLIMRATEIGGFKMKSFDLPPDEEANSSGWLLERIITGLDSFVEYASDVLQEEFTDEVKAEITQIFEGHIKSQ